MTTMKAEGRMKTVEDYAQIRDAYFNQHKSIREIARELKHGRETIAKALDIAVPIPYQRSVERADPVLGPYKGKIEELLAESERLPRKQRYTAQKIFETVCELGYQGSDSGVRHYVAQCRAARRKPAVYLPLAFDPGREAQVDWGEATVIMAGVQMIVQLFVMWLNFSRRLFVYAYPTQKQESFLDGHVQAFRFFGGVPYRISYDNLKTAVYEILRGHQRIEQRAFVAFRSHYLFDSHFCTPAEGHEKGGVEHNVGFSRRNFLVPIPRVTSFGELNAHLLDKCLKNDLRQVKGEPTTIGEAWERERACLRPLPVRDYPCCVTAPVTLTPYSQVIFETNRYSVPVDQAQRKLVVRAYPFRLEILHHEQVIASHDRSYAHEQDIFNPLHYLPLLEQRPGAFEHAKPLRQWRASWPQAYEQLLSQMQEQWPEGRGVREFVQILQLHRDHPADLIEKAVSQALRHHCAHLEGVKLCLHQMLHPDTPPAALDLSELPGLQEIGAQPVNLQHYNQLLSGGR